MDDFYLPGWILISTNDHPHHGPCLSIILNPLFVLPQLFHIFSLILYRTKISRLAFHEISTNRLHEAF